MLRRWFFRSLLAIGVFFGLLYALQDFLVFEGFAVSLLQRPPRRPETLPEGMRSEFIANPSGLSLEIWKLKPAVELPKPYSALIFKGFDQAHGSKNSLHYELQKAGISSLSVDYRGYGLSSGWPSEPGILEDAEALFDYADAAEKIPARNLILVGYSFGAAPAIYLATKFRAAGLILIAPFTSMPDVLWSWPYWWPLTPLLRHEFSNLKRIGSVKTPCVIFLHGKADDFVPYQQSEVLAAALPAGTDHTTILLDGANHVNVWRNGAQDVLAKLLACMEKERV